MATPPASPKPKRSVRRYIRDQYDKLIRPHSRSPSQQSIEASGSGAPPAFLPPRMVSNLLAPPLDAQAAQLRHLRSESQISTSPQNEMEAIPICTGLRSAFEELRKVARPFPPLGSAIGSLISCLGLLEVISTPNL
ncbi:Vegetative incompatibility protein HET-E-1 [Ceratobasidium theobromae]|uniref:Vegetative incompatibility protein HET-E-1 n=1 Tax=Ceratobasidium theobromae TaxID=1582974 RepID=A0A5N5QG84_9AGAM|nr:Vegetative incompatibility protein HET-E-1 [Ceratobasidium theobromae]